MKEMTERFLFPQTIFLLTYIHWYDIDREGLDLSLSSNLFQPHLIAGNEA